MFDKIVIDQRLVDLDNIRLAIAHVDTGDNQNFEDMLISAIMYIQMAQDKIRTARDLYLTTNELSNDTFNN